MKEWMNAVVWDGGVFPESLTCQEVTIPEPHPGWVLVKNLAAGICSSDLHLLSGATRHLIPDQNLPAILGHENAGVVVKLGEGVTAIKPGDRVAVEPLHGCMEFGGTCKMCRVGKYHLCQHGLAHVGIPAVRVLPGGYGEYSIVHSSRLFSIPEHVTCEEAALLDVLAVAVHAVNIAKPALGSSALVFGCGAVGLDLLQCLRAMGITDLIAIARYEYQAELAHRLGAKEVILAKSGVDPVPEVLKITGGWGVDYVFECVGGESDSLNQSIALCSLAGSITVIGEFSGCRPVDLLALQMKEINILSSNSYSTEGARREFQIALELLASTSVDHQPLITHLFSPEDYFQAIDFSFHKGDHKLVKALLVRKDSEISS